MMPARSISGHLGQFVRPDGVHLPAPGGINKPGVSDSVLNRFFDDEVDKPQVHYANQQHSAKPKDNCSSCLVGNADIHRISSRLSARARSVVLNREFWQQLPLHLPKPISDISPLSYKKDSLGVQCRTDR